MAIAQVSKLSMNVSALLTDALDLSTVMDHLVKAYTIDIASGTGASQANQVFKDTRVVTTGATDSLDFSGGGLLNGVRQELALTALKALIIKAASANTTILTVTRPANGVPLFTTSGDSVPVPPNGLFVWVGPVNGVVVTPATGDLLDIVNAAGASATYDVIAIGVQ